MMRLLLLMFLLAMCADAMPGVSEVSFTAADGTTIFGDVYQNDGASKSAPLILLFHQGGGDARGEYGLLAPRLLQAGYNLLAIDQRAGGSVFNGVNRTIENLTEPDYGYCEAYPDLEAALEFSFEYGFDGKVAVWGSSYSAALAFKLAAEHAGKIDAVLAFSPASGEAMGGCRPERYSNSVAAPVLALRPASELEVSYVPAQMKLFREHGHQTFVADPGVHGSSMLNDERVQASTEHTWSVVLEFLANALAEHN